MEFILRLTQEEYNTCLDYFTPVPFGFGRHWKRSYHRTDSDTEEIVIRNNDGTEQEYKIEIIKE